MPSRSRRCAMLTLAALTAITPAALAAPPAKPPVAKTAPAITGSAQTGAALTTTDGTWKFKPAAYTRQWTRCDTTGNACAPIPAATTPTYTPTAQDAGSTLRVTVTATNTDGDGTATSAPSAVIATDQAPVNTAKPAITGSPLTGRVLSATTGTWTGASDELQSQWLRCDASGGTCAPIAGQTAATYTVTDMDVASTLRYQVTATNPAGSTVSVSDPSAVAWPAARMYFNETDYDTGTAAFASALLDGSDRRPVSTSTEFANSGNPLTLGPDSSAWYAQPAVSDTGAVTSTITRVSEDATTTTSFDVAGCYSHQRVFATVSKVIYQCAGGWPLEGAYVANLDGSDPVKLPLPADTVVRVIGVSATGTVMLETAGSAGVDGQAITAINLDGSGLRTVDFREGGTSRTPAAVSPDGQHIMTLEYDAGHQATLLREIDADGQANPAVDGTLSALASSPVTYLDDTHVLFTLKPDLSALQVGVPFDLYPLMMLDTSTGQATRVLPGASVLQDETGGMTATGVVRVVWGAR